MPFDPILIAIGIFALLILLSGIFTVKQSTAAVVERFGRFHSIRNGFACQ